jgi:hypothetical protein
MRNVELRMSWPEEMKVGIRSWRFPEFRIPNFEFHISDLASLARIWRAITSLAEPT